MFHEWGAWRATLFCVECFLCFALQFYRFFERNILFSCHLSAIRAHVSREKYLLTKLACTRIGTYTGLLDPVVYSVRCEVCIKYIYHNHRHIQLLYILIARNSNSSRKFFKSINIRFEMNVRKIYYTFIGACKSHRSLKQNNLTATEYVHAKPK